MHCIPSDDCVPLVVVTGPLKRKRTACRPLDGRSPPPFSSTQFRFSLQPLPAGYSKSDAALTMVYSDLQDEFGKVTGRQVLRKHLFLGETCDVFADEI